MHTETRQISSLRSQYISKEIRSNLVRKDVAELNDKSYHFPDPTLEKLKRAFNNYTKLKLRFLSTPTLFQYILKPSPISIMQPIRTPQDIF